ncbi:hypothetical protein G6F31_014749 [Rhizopus arrhizus]|nr:hypothetical protein G6F31_014749 [Rhizopus arrhizus]
MPTLVGILPVDQGRRLPRQWAACVVVDANLGWHAVRRPRSTPTWLECLSSTKVDFCRSGQPRLAPLDSPGMGLPGQRHYHVHTAKEDPDERGTPTDKRPGRGQPGHGHRQLDRPALRGQHRRHRHRPHGPRRNPPPPA